MPSDKNGQASGNAVLRCVVLDNESSRVAKLLKIRRISLEKFQNFIEQLEKIFSSYVRTETRTIRFLTSKKRKSLRGNIVFNDLDGQRASKVKRKASI